MTSVNDVLSTDSMSQKQKQDVLSELWKNVSTNNTSLTKATVDALLTNHMIPLLVKFINKENGDEVILKSLRVVLNCCAFEDTGIASNLILEAGLLSALTSLYPYFLKNRLLKHFDEALHLLANISADHEMVNEQQMNEIIDFTVKCVIDCLPKTNYPNSINNENNDLVSLVTTASFALQNICHKSAKFKLDDKNICRVLDSINLLLDYYFAKSNGKLDDAVVLILSALGYLYSRDTDKTETLLIVQYSDQIRLIQKVICLIDYNSNRTMRRKALDALEKISTHDGTITKYLTQHSTYFEKLNLIIQDTNLTDLWSCIAWVISNLIIDDKKSLFDSQIIRTNVLSNLVENLHHPTPPEGFIKEMKHIIYNIVENVVIEEKMRPLLEIIATHIHLVISHHLVTLNETLSILQTLLEKDDSTNLVKQIVYKTGTLAQLSKLVTEGDDLFPIAKSILETHFSDYLNSKLRDSGNPTVHVHIYVGKNGNPDLVKIENSSDNTKITFEKSPSRYFTWDN